VRAIEALGAIEPPGWLERAIARLLLSAYKRRLAGRLLDEVGWAALDSYILMRRINPYSLDTQRVLEEQGV
jgi:hypothetical protein